MVVLHGYLSPVNELLVNGLKTRTLLWDSFVRSAEKAMMKSRVAPYDRAKLKIKMIKFPNMSSAFESMWATQACVNGVLTYVRGQLSFVKPLHKKLPTPQCAECGLWP